MKKEEKYTQDLLLTCEARHHRRCPQLPLWEVSAWGLHRLQLSAFRFLLDEERWDDSSGTKSRTTALFWKERLLGVSLQPRFVAGSRFDWEVNNSTSLIPTATRILL
jgi:hypothetical protein